MLSTHLKESTRKFGILLKSCLCSIVVQVNTLGTATCNKKHLRGQTDSESKELTFRAEGPFKVGDHSAVVVVSTFSTGKTVHCPLKQDTNIIL